MDERKSDIFLNLGLTAAGDIARRRFVGASAVDALGVVQEARVEYREQFNSGDLDAHDLVREAMNALGDFQKSPDDTDAWKALARAGAAIHVALERVTPAYAARPPYGPKAAASRARRERWGAWK